MSEPACECLGGGEEDIKIHCVQICCEILCLFVLSPTVLDEGPKLASDEGIPPSYAHMRSSYGYFNLKLANSLINNIFSPICFPSYILLCITIFILQNIIFQYRKI